MADVDLITKLLEEELDRKTEREDRIKAVKRLRDVALAIGKEKTLEMLIPLVDRKITDDVDEDEMMLAVSEVLGNLVPDVGGPEHAMVLFEPLLKLSKVEETLVRDSATRSLTKVINLAKPTEPHAKLATEGLTAMYGDTECFFSKLSACAITPPIYRICKAADTPEEALKAMRTTFAEQVEDETPMIRRSAASAIGELALAIEDPATICSEILPMLDKLFFDEVEQDTVRVLAVKQVPLLMGPGLLTAPGAVQSESTKQIVDKCVDIVKAAAVDSSWRVRDATSKEFPKFAEAFKQLDVPAADLATTFASLLVDKETEVRLTAVKEIKNVALGVGAKNFSTHVLDVFDSVFEMGGDADPTSKVKNALATEMTKLFEVMSEDEASIEKLLKMCLKLVSTGEPSSDSALLCVMVALKDIAPIVGGSEAHSKQLLTWLQKFIDTSASGGAVISAQSWRLRRAVILAMAPVTQKLGVDVFQADLLEPYLASFHDQISEVRTAATEAVGGIKDAFGVDFVMNKILAPLKDDYVKHTYFLNRLVTIEAYKGVLSSTIDNTKAAAVFAFLVNCVTDPVPNVRFTTVVALGKGAEFANDEDVRVVIRPALERVLAEDTDDDVKFFAEQALKKLGT